MAENPVSDNLFKDFAVDYDRMINWPVRLKREEPFFRQIFERNSAAKVLDAACGTGQHAMMFAAWGLDVSAIDVSEAMIAKARQAAVEVGRNINFRVMGIEEAGLNFSEEFDVVTCIGNSLPHIKSHEGLQQALLSLGGVLKSGGQLVLQLRNYQRVMAREEKFMPLNTRVENGQEFLYLRMTELGQELVTFNIIVLARNEGGKWSYRVESEKLRPWTAPDVEEYLKKTGFKITGIYGDLVFTDFTALDSIDLVIVACKS